MVSDSVSLLDAELSLRWAEAAQTSAGLFWMAFWAFGLGYFVSSLIQVFLTEARMQRSMGEAGAGSVLLGTFFGFVSSSCSFAALGTTRSLIAKGAGLVPALAFLLASTNLVIELGIVIGAFLSWHFVVGEYLGGLLLIGFTWVLVRLTASERFRTSVRERARESSGLGDGDDADVDIPSYRTLGAWRQVARRYLMEWQMVWKDVTIGFTVAGVIAAFVPRTFFTTLFLGAGDESLSFAQVLAQALVGPVAAFFTFIGSMGNIPLAAVLYSNGVSFAGVMAFIFSDLVVFPVLRIQATYYGWRFAVYVLAVFGVALVLSALALHYGFALVGWLPDARSVQSVTDRSFFRVDHTLVLNAAFALLSAAAVALAWSGEHDESDSGGDHATASFGTWALRALTLGCAGWLMVGLVLSVL